MKDIHVGKNCGFKMQNMILVQQYMHKTKRSFSKTLNIILEEWDRYSLEIAKLKRQAENQKMDEYAADIKKAEVIKE